MLQVEGNVKAVVVIKQYHLLDSLLGALQSQNIQLMARLSDALFNNGLIASPLVTSASVIAVGELDLPIDNVKERQGQRSRIQAEDDQTLCRD